MINSFTAPIWREGCQRICSNQRLWNHTNNERNNCNQIETNSSTDEGKHSQIWCLTFARPRCRQRDLSDTPNEQISAKTESKASSSKQRPVLVEMNDYP